MLYLSGAKRNTGQAEGLDLGEGAQADPHVRRRFLASSSLGIWETGTEEGGSRKDRTRVCFFAMLARIQLGRAGTRPALRLRHLLCSVRYSHHLASKPRGCYGMLSDPSQRKCKRSE